MRKCLSRELLKLLGDTLQEFALSADTKNPLHVEFLHAANGLLTHEMAKAQIKALQHG